MRPVLPALLLPAVLPAMAQGVEPHWEVDVHTLASSLDGHFRGTSGGQPFDVDFRDDLGLERDDIRLGVGLEYQGPRFAVELALDREDANGTKTLQRDVKIDGQTFPSGAPVTSSLKTTYGTLTWTVRILAGDTFWAGLDLGVRATRMELDAASPGGGGAHFKVTLPFPQAGPAVGFTALDGRLAGRALILGLAYQGATYLHFGADLRYFPLDWLGARVFLDGERIRVPRGSLKDDLDVGLDRTGGGVGLVARF